jgi:hypothetical protein
MKILIKNILISLAVMVAGFLLYLMIGLIVIGDLDGVFYPLGIITSLYALFGYWDIKRNSN